MELNGLRTDPLSRAVVRLIPVGASGHELASATGFFYTFNNKAFLITNWHVVAGRASDTLKCSDKVHGCLPTKLRFSVYSRTEGNREIACELALYRDESFETPAWLQHPMFGERVDVVAIEVPNIAAHCRPINHETDWNSHLTIGQDAWVIGFPFQNREIHFLPLWKRATVATEPNLALNALPLFYIDTSTKDGFSGSPVIGVRVGVTNYGPTRRGTKTLGEIRTFAGVYSGRIGDPELGAQVGRVWNKLAIDQIISHGQLGESSFHYYAIQPFREPEKEE